MKHIPNLITGVRLVAALILFFSSIFEVAYSLQLFLPLFAAAGISDLLDGLIARRFNLCTEFGAKLDSVADLSLYSAVILFLWVNEAPALVSCGALLLFGGAIQVFHLVLSMQRFRQFPAYHTDFARGCAYLMFFGVITFWLTKGNPILSLLALTWIACSCEGIAITLVLTKPRSNLRGIGAALSAE